MVAVSREFRIIGSEIVRPQVEDFPPLTIVECRRLRKRRGFTSTRAGTALATRASGPASGGSRGVNDINYRELVRDASFAASSHNTQPWKFKIDAERISILPDFTRRCPVVDPDDHHLFVSLGCAAENLLLSAEAAGLRGDMAFDESSDGGTIRIALETAAACRSPLAASITRRQCTRAEYSFQPVPASELKLLDDAGTGADGGALLLTDKAQIETVAEYVAEGNVTQLGDRKFKKELAEWIRFNTDEASRTRDGLSARSTGNPEVPRWIGKRFMRVALSAKKQNEKDIRHIRSSAGLAVFTSEQDDKAHWIGVGRRYERFALQATALGLRNAFINQPVEVAALRPQLASWLGLGHRRPDLLVRFGYGPEMPRSLRRPVDEILL
ncbi:MAG TPA: hypothetical protein VFZ31_13600 [Vicinamibacterales bacterium]